MTTQPTQPENDDNRVTVEESSASYSPATGDAAEPAAFAPVQETQTPAPALPFTGEQSVPPFTAFIEEFRQREERLSAVADAPSSLLPEDSKDLSDHNNNGSYAEQPETSLLSAAQESPEQAEPTASDARDSTPSTSAAPVERPVSPLLRPASRIRGPRQGGGRHRETFVTQASASAPAKTELLVPQETPAAQIEQSSVPTPTTEESKAEESESPRPARRYRFDRPAPNAQSTASSKPIAPAPSPARSEEGKDTRLPTENVQAGEQPKTTNDAVSVSAEPQTSTGTTLTALSTREAVPSPESETTTSSARANNDRRRRHGQESQRAKAQSTTAPTATPAPVTSPAEEPVPGTQAETPIVPEVPVEDLPPLEYSELQAASRRRRRHRTGATNGNGIAPAARAAAQQTTASAPATPARTAATPPVSMPPTPAAPITPSTAYTIQSGATVSQMNQGNDLTGPFQGPEPAPARGSVFPTQPRLARPLRNGNEPQRTSLPGTPAARGDGLLSTGAVNHLASVISQAIQIQSDRMAAELRRSNQTPANISVSLPPFPSTERVGVFVDVANLLYSARTLRMTVDFGKLLDFLRGNRRLVRAHAYCPTSPQPGDDQMFLQAVKGLGYRITTKNYKTFASGAKKADMDLDLCMDVVRLVDGKAVDCIVLVSGDSDFMPMLDYCSDHGVRVEIAAFDESMSATLRQSCDLFINLSMLDEIRVP